MSRTAPDTDCNTGPLESTHLEDRIAHARFPARRRPGGLVADPVRVQAHRTRSCARRSHGTPHGHDTGEAHRRARQPQRGGVGADLGGVPRHHHPDLPRCCRPPGCRTEGKELGCAGARRARQRRHRTEACRGDGCGRDGIGQLALPGPPDPGRQGIRRDQLGPVGGREEGQAAAGRGGFRQGRCREGRDHPVYLEPRRAPEGGHAGQPARSGPARGRRQRVPRPGHGAGRLRAERQREELPAPPGRAAVPRADAVRRPDR